jgi:hypothetical protein
MPGIRPCCWAQPSNSPRPNTRCPNHSQERPRQRRKPLWRRTSSRIPATHIADGAKKLCQGRFPTECRFGALAGSRCGASASNTLER